MAVFLINICKFNGCGITFPSLGDLIQHIEDTHIDYDPQVIEQKEQSRPACLPLSYVLRFITDAARKEGPFLGTSGAELKRKLAIKHHSYSMTSSNRSLSPTDLGSEMDEDEMLVSESEDSNDSWTTEEFSSEFIMRYGSRHSGPVGNSSSNEKPFACPVPGCKKRYKNVNGIKYHSKNGHKKDGKVRKGYKCHCGKSYKTSQGLKNHSMMAHNNASNGGSGGGGSGGGGGGSGGGHGGTMTADTMSSAGHIASPSQSGSLSPSSASNTSGGSSSSINQSQLSPNSNSISSSSNVHHQNNGNGGSTNHHQSTATANCLNIINNNNNNNNNPIKNSFGLISLKSKLNAGGSGGAGGTHHNSNNKLVNDKLLGGNGSETGDVHGLKMSLPSLVNLGILTPATSPKQQQQQQQHHHHHHHHNHHSNNGGGTTTGSHHHHHVNHNLSTDCLPLTPISPNMSKNVNFNNNNNAGADNITTDET